MSEELPPKAELHPISRMLFGWAFLFKRGGVVLSSLALAGLVLLVAELAIGRAPLQFPLEDLPGFYLAAGAIVVAATLLIAAGLSAALGAAPPAGDDP